MNVIKRFVSLLLLLVLIISSMTFYSCADGKNPAVNTEAHIHEFEWIGNEAAHWQECKCGKIEDIEGHISGGEATHKESEKCVVCGYEISEKLKTFDGQRVLIIGNSYVFWGHAVILQLTNIRTQEERNDDRGYFYQLCQENERDVFVTNWTFGGHALHHLLADECTMDRLGCNKGGVCHRTDLVDLDYDYVIISPSCGDKEEKEITKSFGQLRNMLMAANPDVQIICLGNLGAHGISSIKQEHPGIYESYKTLEKAGIIIADWGGMVDDILEGRVEIPGAKCTYTKNTFIAPDGYHPNQLSAYIQCLMAYCAVTGESAVGQPYEFCFDKSINSKFNLDPYQYVNRSDYPGYTTNMADVFMSPEDMLGIQMLIDRYLAEKPYRN